MENNLQDIPPIIELEIKENEKTVATKTKHSGWGKKIAYLVLILMIWFISVQYIAADKYEAVVKISDTNKVGVNPSTDKLDYGDLPKGKTSTRFITIENNGSMASYIKIVKTGSIGELITLSKNDFELKPKEKEKLELTLSLPISADLEEYKGEVIVFKIPKPF